MDNVRILLADDHSGFLDMEEHLLAPEFEIVGKVNNGQGLLEEAMRVKPDVIVTDISMPKLNGIAAVERLRESSCKAQIIFLTVHPGIDFVRRCLAIGAVGYVVKSRMAADLIPAIRAAMNGRSFVSEVLLNN